MNAYLIDTNVLLAASAYYHPASKLFEVAEPGAESIGFRELIFNELKIFAESDDKLVLDVDGVILHEYEKNLPYFNEVMMEQEYGMYVIQKKLQTLHEIDGRFEEEVSWVLIDTHGPEDDRIAQLHPPLDRIVTDTDDRKWVAAAKAHEVLHGIRAPIVYGAETDWFKIRTDLQDHGIELRQLLPDVFFEQYAAND